MHGDGVVAELTLAERRFNAGLTPEQLGQKAGVSGMTIRRLEESGRRPTPAIAKKLANHFGVQPSELWPLEEEREASAA